MQPPVDTDSLSVTGVPRPFCAPIVRETDVTSPTPNQSNAQTVLPTLPPTTLCAPTFERLKASFIAALASSISPCAARRQALSPTYALVMRVANET